MKIGQISRINLQDLANRGAVPGWLSPLATVLNSFIDTISAALLNRITFADNFFGVELLQNFSDGVELDVGIPGGYRVRGVTLIDSSGIPTSSLAFSRKSPGRIGMTVNFERPNTLITTGNTLNGSSSVSNIASLVRIVPGMMIHGTAIPSGTRVSSTTGTSAIIESNATATQTGTTLIFGPGNAITSFGDTTTGSNSLVNVTNLENVTKGTRVFGVGIPEDCVVDSISGSTVTLNAQATTTGTTAPLVFVRTSKVPCTIQVQL